VTDSEITLSVLREIRDSVRTLDARLTGRIDGTNTKLDGLTDKVDKGFERMDLTFAHFVVELKDLAVQIMLLGRYLRNRTEVDLQDLIERVTKIEAKVFPA
jgi:hypothetical protein